MKNLQYLFLVAFISGVVSEAKNIKHVQPADDFSIIDLLMKHPLDGVTQLVKKSPNKFIPHDKSSFQAGVYCENFDVVEGGALYRSAQLSPDRLEFYIEQYGIKSVLNLRGEHPELQWWLDEKAVLENKSIAFYNVALSANTLTSKENIRTILHVFDTAPRPILIHCRAGVDRTGEVAALWVLDQQKKTTKEALEELSVWHRHVKILHPAKTFFISIWQGREWFEEEYDPVNYPLFKHVPVNEK